MPKGPLFKPPEEQCDQVVSTTDCDVTMTSYIKNLAIFEIFMSENIVTGYYPHRKTNYRQLTFLKLNHDVINASIRDYDVTVTS